jgi:hypothetical protein
LRLRRRAASDLSRWRDSASAMAAIVAHE